MAAPKPKDPLDALQALLNDVLVQTGKALRASRRDGQGNLAPPQGLSQSKLPVTIEAFQKALDDIEGDIMIAKSVILRDLNQLQADQSTGQQQQCSLPFPSSLKQSTPSPSTSIPRLPPQPQPTPNPPRAAPRHGRRQHDQQQRWC